MSHDERIMLRSRLCDYRGSFILVRVTKTVENKAAKGQLVNNDNKKVIFNIVRCLLTA